MRVFRHQGVEEILTTEATLAEVQEYVPGYSLRAEPQYDEARDTWNGNARVAVFLRRSFTPR